MCVCVCVCVCDGVEAGQTHTNILVVLCCVVLYLAAEFVQTGSVFCLIL